MPESILVGVVDTHASRGAVEWAARRAYERGSRLTLISIVGGAIGAVGEEEILREALALTEAMLAREATGLQSRGLTVDTRLARGDPVRELIDASMVCDLLVIGSDHRGPPRGDRRGLHGVRIAAGAHSPVAVVPEIDLSDRSGVVVGIDGSADSERALEFAAEEADRAGDVLTAVMTWTTVPLPLGMHGYPSTYLSGMQQVAEETLAIALAGIGQQYPDLVVQRVVERGSPGRTIGDRAATARLAVVGSHGRGALARFLLGSTSEEVLARLATATVVVR